MAALLARKYLQVCHHCVSFKLLQGGSFAWSFAPQLNLPIFDSGSLGANLHRADAERDEVPQPDLCDIGIPVTGMISTHIPMLSNTWAKNNATIRKI